MGGLRWSESDHAIVYKDGSTFAFNKEIERFLWRFGSAGQAIHFGYTLHLLDLLRHRRAGKEGEIGRLRRAFAEAERNYCNAGVLAATLAARFRACLDRKRLAR